MSCKCIRICYNIRTQPISSHQFRQCVQSVQTEEWTRLQKFVFKDDLLSSMIGRILLRYAVVKLCNCKWSELVMGRTDKGKPYVKQPDIDFSVNVSHQGDYVLLAASCSDQCGVDVMKREKPRRYNTASEYIDFMSRQYSKGELAKMRSQPTDNLKMAYFYRYWCLKESIIKATGEGIHSDLASLDFQSTDDIEQLPMRIVVSNTKLLNNGQHDDKWRFEECRIDADHSAAVCVNAKSLTTDCRSTKRPIPFSDIALDEVLSIADYINPLPENALFEWEAFENRKSKPF